VHLIDFIRIFKIKRTTQIAILSAFFALMAFKTFAIQPETTAEKAKTEHETYDPSKAILEHIADSHSWMVLGKTIIHLPVILYTDKGLENFSSAVFNSEESVYHGKYYNYKLIEEKIKAVDANGHLDQAASSHVYDFSITKNVVALWIAILLLLVIFISIAGTYNKRINTAPKGLQSFLEPIIVFVRDDIARPNIGYKYQRYMPFLLTVFFFILINNLVGLVPFFPGGSNVTGNIAVTFVLAIITMIVVNVNGNKYYWKHIFAPDVPILLYIIMIPIEIIGIISRPFALMIRLFANITAGHIIVLSLISLIFVFKSIAVAPVSVAFVVFMDVLELLVAFLQAFIFTLLTALFIGTATEEHHY